jgi:uncharacterized protein
MPKKKGRNKMKSFDHIKNIATSHGLSDGKTINIKEEKMAEIHNRKSLIEDAEAAYQRRDYASALRVRQPLAEQGDSEAQFYLGITYSDGRGVTRDDREAATWFRRAAEQGLVQAQFNLGDMYLKGQGVTQNYSEAAKWFRRAAEQGDWEAQSYLGMMYQKGQGVTQNYSEAATWYQLAAEQGLVQAQFNLGVMYQKGQGVTRDIRRAYSLLSRAAPNLSGGTKSDVELGRLIKKRRLNS